VKAEKTISSETVFEGRAINVRIDTVRRPDGVETTREIVEHPPCVAILAVDENNNVILERQFRKSIEKVLLEIPAGGIEPGESPAAAVRRELREETGLSPKNVKRLAGFYSSPGYSDEYLYLYLATELTPSPLEAEDTAGIDVVRVPLDEIPALLASGKVNDAKTVAGLHMLLEHAKKANSPRSNNQASS
jgi:ADP-ribose pyrophosphatase